MDNKQERIEFKMDATNKQLIDNRVEIKNILTFPSNVVVYVKTTFYKIGDEKKERIGCIHGSGIFIAPFVVLTCAHNLIPPDKHYQINPEKIRCYQAYHQHLGYQYQVEDYKIPQLYKDNIKVNNEIAKKYDFAIIYLKDMKYPLKFNYYPSCIWNYSNFIKTIKQDVKNTNKEADRQQNEKQQTNLNEQIAIVSYGYPNDKNRQKLLAFKQIITNDNVIGYQYQSKGLILSIDRYLIWYNMKANEGQSGSPIFIIKGNQILLLGIHKAETFMKQQSYGIPLWQMKEQINDWHKQKYQKELIEDQKPPPFPSFNNSPC